MAKINVSNLNKKRRISLSLVRDLAGFVLRKVSRKKKITVNVIFASDAEIKRLNRKYTDRAVSTDVLCFCFFEGMPLKGMGAGSGTDIYISSDEACKNAKRFKTSFKDELLLYVIHGILHMAGYRDKTVDERKKMNTIQEDLLVEFKKRRRV